MTMPSKIDSGHLAQIRRIQVISERMAVVSLTCEGIPDYRAGQFIKVMHSARKPGYFSLASSPCIEKSELVLHVQKGGAGSVSAWIHDELETGHWVHISPPMGHGAGTVPDPDTPLLFIATGSGMAPVYGIVRHLLVNGHRGRIRVYHGVRHHRDLYLHEHLQGLTRLYPNTRYFPCVSRDDAMGEIRHGRALDLALNETPLSDAWRVYLFGNPAMVESGWARLVDLGLDEQNIYSDHRPK